MPRPYYADDLVELWHGDALEVDVWLAADVLVTDPPYGIAWAAGALSDKRARRDASEQSIQGDQDTTVRDQALALWGTRPAIVFGSWRQPRPAAVTHRLIWHKANRQPGITTAPVYSNDEEVYLLRGGWVGKPMQSVITTTEHRGRQPELIGHPTPKPVGLMERLIEKTAGTIADPFAGSGATLVAARNLGRKAIGVELEERYCEVTARRLAHTVFDFGEWEA